MSIYSRLHSEHIQIKNLMNDIADFGNEDSDRKYAIFDDLKKLLLVHARAEEKAFYARLQSFPDLHAQLAHAQEEHQEAESLIEELSSNKLAGAAWHSKFMKLKSEVEHHIQEEESNVFKLSKDRVGAAVESRMKCSLEEHERELTA